MGHLIENAVGRCTEPEHVGKDRPCTWLSVADVNQATDHTVTGPFVRELGLALGEHATRLLNESSSLDRSAAWDGRADILNKRMDLTDRLARILGVDDLAGLMLPWQEGG